MPALRLSQQTPPRQLTSSSDGHAFRRPDLVQCLLNVVSNHSREHKRGDGRCRSPTSAGGTQHRKSVSVKQR
jgi:hypothetical protein